MYNTKTPDPSELPTSKALLRSTALAAGVALVLLFSVVMPAEYGVDPTGIGRLLGLKQMGEIKTQLAAEAAADAQGDAGAPAGNAAMAPAPVAAAADSATAAPGGVATDTVEVALQPGQGREIKLVMREGARVEYEWTVAGGVVNSDTHADRPGTAYHGYAKGQRQAADRGVLVAAFDGKHGWFWRNRGDSPVTVTLRTRGDYRDLQEIE